MVDLIRGMTPFYIVDFTDSGVDVVGITKTTIDSPEERTLIFLNPQHSEN